ncbi:MAG: hypothetical protein WC748_01665 [Legionellales bacterium]|jgi:hypothetical protein
MASRIIRKRIFLAVEDKNQALMKWLYWLLEDKNCNIHLDYEPLNGGGYESMLQKAITTCKRKDRNTAKHNILLVDTDRADSNNDAWSIAQLKAEAEKRKFIVCLQVPNLEGILYLMLPGKERSKISVSNAYNLLCKEWPEYENGLTAHMLRSKFSFHDLLRVAKVDLELKRLLTLIGLIDDH